MIDFFPEMIVVTKCEYLMSVYCFLSNSCCNKYRSGAVTQAVLSSIVLCVLFLRSGPPIYHWLPGVRLDLPSPWRWPLSSQSVDCVFRIQSAWVKWVPLFFTPESSQFLLFIFLVGFIFVSILYRYFLYKLRIFVERRGQSPSFLVQRFKTVSYSCLLKEEI